MVAFPVTFATIVRENNENRAMARIKEVEFWSFKDALQRAHDYGRKIDPNDKDEWRAWLKAHRMSEPMMEEFAKSRFMAFKKIILTEDPDWEGFYMYSDDDEGAICWDAG
jgi:hypothetical protein